MEKAKLIREREPEPDFCDEDFIQVELDDITNKK